ncbi:MAG: hypothetical protein H6565_13500 [Lewinellaceae bacterium]|nr:hypothetical protein [Lewinellaceae bacterium]MCB9354528.1 hypothetical protein [Lewinellaceae bacterium]
MHKSIAALALILLCASLPANRGLLHTDCEHEGFHFFFKDREMWLRYPMRKGAGNYLLRGNFSNRKLDTLSNWYDTEKHYVEIIRQDDPVQPGIGMALGFEFDADNDTFPFTPSYAFLQLKNFAWGGVEFSPRDTLNYSGVTNEVSNDLTIEILQFSNDTITGRFSGLLLSGGGPMAPVTEGRFCARLYRR